MPSNDHYFNSDVVLGYQLNSDLSLGVNFNDTAVRTSVNSNLMRSVFMSYRRDHLSFILGGGYYESSLQSRDVTIYGLVRLFLGSSLDITR